MRLIQNSFIGGEIAPELFGRHDLEAYFHAAKTLRNFSVRKTGGLRKRQGTQLLFDLSAEGASAFRVFPYFYDRTAYGAVVLYRKTEGTTIFYRLYKSDGEALGDEASVAAGVATLASDDDLAALKCKQIGDTLFFSSRARAVFSGFVDYAAGTVRWEKMTGQINVPAPPVLNATATGFGTSDDGYVRSTRRYCIIGVKNSVYSRTREKNVSISLPWKAGAYVTLSFTANWAQHDYYMICVMLGGQWQILNTFYPDAEQDPPPTAMSMTDDNINYGDIAGVMEPVKVGDTDMDVDVVDVWEQRLVMASSANKPFTMWFSRRGDVTNFYTTRPQTGDDAFELTLAVTTASRILHTITGRWFVMFTESGEYSVDSADKSGFAYNTAICKKTSNVGAHEGIDPVMTEAQILFVAADGKTVYELSYNLEQDNIMPQNRSILASHMTEGAKIRKIAYMRFPEPQILCLLENGDILNMTYIPEQKIYAWSRTVFSGGGLRCIDIAVPGSIREEAGLESSSEVLLMFARDGEAGRVWVERFRAPSVGDVQDAGKAKCADHCGYGEENYPDGEHDPQTNVAATAVTVRPEFQDFNSFGQYKNIYDCFLRLNRSGTVKIRPDTDRLADVSSSLQAEASPVVADGNVTLVTKDVQLLPFAYQNTDGRMVITSDDGWPCEILSVLYNIEVADYGPREA